MLSCTAAHAPAAMVLGSCACEAVKITLRKKCCGVLRPKHTVLRLWNNSKFTLLILCTQDIDNEPIEQALLHQLDQSTIDMITECFTVRLCPAALGCRNVWIDGSCQAAGLAAAWATRPVRVSSAPMIASPAI